ncbi:DNRLRE domain-containing protein [Kroppenstedtia eburnea]|uniref:DNRLRE domain-containing protein n=1 Tax=Kroppenstedtia eburnea TaxID=714067 RepID=UPI00362FDD96
MNKRKQRGKALVWTVIFTLLWAMMPWPLISSVTAGEKSEVPNHSVEELTDGPARHDRTWRNSDSTQTVEIQPESISGGEKSSPAWKSTDQRGARGVEEKKKHLSKAGIDTYVQEKYPDYNYLHSPELRTGHATQVGKTRSYIRFGSKLPDLDGGLLISARFKAYKYYEYPNRAVDTTIRIHSANWNPAGIHWNKQPGIGASHAGRFFPKGAADGWYDWNVTRLVKDWYDHPTRNRGLVMQAANEETDGSYRKFYSADYSDGKYAPRLELTYSPKPAPPTGTVVSNGPGSKTGYINLTWNSVPGAEGYKVLIFNGESYDSVDVGNVTRWSSKGKKLWPTASRIAAGAYNYQIRVVAYNAYGETAPSEAYRPLIPDQTPPSRPGKPVWSSGANDRFTFTWASSGVNRYRVYMGTAPGQADLVNGTEVTTNRYTHPKALDLRTTCYLYVVAVNGAGDVSPPSETGRGGGWPVWHWRPVGISPPSPFRSGKQKGRRSRAA